MKIKLIKWLTNEWTWRRLWYILTLKRCHRCNRKWVRRGDIFFKADGECEYCWLAMK